MDNYINKVIEQMQENCESHANIEWVKSVLSELSKLSFEAGQQSKQAKAEELQEEFAKDERFLRESIKDKDLKIANLEYLQGMDKELIQTLQGRSSALQHKVNELQKRVDAALEIIMEYYTGSYDESPDLVVDLEQALKGEV